MPPASAEGIRVVDWRVNMAMSGRDATLDTIRRQLRQARESARARATQPHGVGAHVPPGGAARGTVPDHPSASALIDRFAGELTALGGRVHRAAALDGVVAAVLTVCRAHDATRILSWSASALGLPGLLEAVAAGGLSVDTGELPAGAGRAERLSELDPIAIGLTGADAAIAESGTLALCSGPGRGRLASLLPPVHVAVVRTCGFHATLPDFLAARPDLIEHGSNLVLITGPSRTADIEMTLTRGVHGPGEVHVVVAEF
jgi:L-lactate dehydrogenase complex protein LldG